MEQWVYGNNGRGKRRQKIAYFFRETFRPHTRAEYAEAFTRGIGENKEGFAPLPWLYVRAFALFFILFGLIVFISRATLNYFDYPVLFMFGGLFVNLPLLIFFYELYPKRDFSFLVVLGVLLVGGLISVMICGLGYRYVLNDPFLTPWLSQLWTGFLEEVSKALPAIAAILLLKKRDPLCCFILGAAVGTGFSICEDMGYMYGFSHTYSIAQLDFQWGVLCAVGRGFSCVCSHAPWTAVVCWTFAKVRRPFLNFRFYAVWVLSMLLHYFANLPFYASEVAWYKGGVAIWAVGIAVIFTEMILMVRSSRRALLPGEEERDFSPRPLFTAEQRLRRRADVTAVVSCLALSLLACVFCIIPAGNEYVTLTFASKEEFLDYMQGGLSLTADWSREYDGQTSDYAQYAVDGQVQIAVQKQTVGAYDYFYFYRFDAAEDGEEPATVLPSSIAVLVENVLYYCAEAMLYEDGVVLHYHIPAYPQWIPLEPEVDEIVDDAEEKDEGETGTDGEDTPQEGEDGEETDSDIISEVLPSEILYFFVVSNAVFWDYDGVTQTFTVRTGEVVYKGLVGQIAVAGLAGAVALGGAAAYINLKIKARRYQENAE